MSTRVDFNLTDNGVTFMTELQDVMGVTSCGVVAQEVLDFFGRCVDEARQQRLIGKVRSATGDWVIASLNPDTLEVISILLTKDMLKEVAQKYAPDAINPRTVFFGS